MDKSFSEKEIETKEARLAEIPQEQWDAVVSDLVRLADHVNRLSENLRRMIIRAEAWGQMACFVLQDKGIETTENIGAGIRAAYEDELSRQDLIQKGVAEVLEKVMAGLKTEGEKEILKDIASELEAERGF